MIRVLVVEDSEVVRKQLIHILSADPEIQVVATANDGEEAIGAARRSKPDLVTMDVSMSKMDGFEATRAIMETTPAPIIIVTGSVNIDDVETSFRAIEAGALTVVQKPGGIGHPDYETQAKEFIRTVKLMSEVKVVRRWARRPERTTPSPDRDSAAIITPAHAEIKVVAIGASTGGPPIIQKILAALPKDFSAPVLVVQHMAAGFTQGFTEWLNQSSQLPVYAAIDGGTIIPGHVYIAPDGLQMKVDMYGRIVLSCDDPENGLRPSVSSLFRSIADAFGKNAAGVLLTGMGKDGAEGLKLMKEKGAITIAQDEESSVIFGMPGEAIKLNAAQYVLSPEKIALALSGLARIKNEIGGKDRGGSRSQPGTPA